MNGALIPSDAITRDLARCTGDDDTYYLIVKIETRGISAVILNVCQLVLFCKVFLHGVDIGVLIINLDFIVFS